MNYTLNWILNLVDKVTAPLKGVAQTAGQASLAMGRAQGSAASFGDKMLRLNQTAQALAGMEQVLSGIVSPGAKFEQQVANLSAITGVTGAGLDDLASRARAMAKEFGTSASDNVEAFKGILSRLGSDIAKSPAALGEMARNVNILSKATGDDVVASMDALTTAVLQFQVDLSNPTAAAAEMTRMMNVMAAGAKEGAAEVPQIADALKVAGVAASGANVSFAEANAAIQALAAGGRYGAEAGTALRNVLGKLGEGRFLPKEVQNELMRAGVDVSKLSDKTLGFTARMRELQKIQNDSALVTKLFGTENAAAANILLRSVDAQDELRKKISGTDTAVQQASVNMNTYQERMARLRARFEYFDISVFNATKSFIPFIIGTSQIATGVAQLASAAEVARSGFNALRSGIAQPARLLRTRHCRRPQLQPFPAF